MLPLLVVQHAADAPVARLGEWLAGAGVPLDVRAMHEGATLPPDLTGHSGLLVLGAAFGVYDDGLAPWLAQVRELLAEAVRIETPTLGVCLGAQLVAAALGGQVESAPDGPELGAQLVAKRAAASAADPLFRELPITPDVLQWHFDAITALPAGAVLLASSPVYDVQAFRLGRLCWGVQFHIETTPEIVRDWAETDTALIEFADVERLVQRSDAAHPDIEETWRPFAERFAGVLADPESVRIGRGAQVSTAAPIDDPAAIRAALAEDMQAARMPASMLPMPTRRGDES